MKNTDLPKEAYLTPHSGIPGVNLRTFIFEFVATVDPPDPSGNVLILLDRGKAEYATPVPVTVLHESEEWSYLKEPTADTPVHSSPTFAPSVPLKTIEPNSESAVY